MSTSLRLTFVLAIFFAAFAISCTLERWASISVEAQDPEEVRLRAEANRANAEWWDAVERGAPTEEVARKKARWQEANNRWLRRVRGR